MFVTLEDKTVIRGDLLKSVILRYDLSPIPSTVELEIRTDEKLTASLIEGKSVYVNGDRFYIVKTLGINQKAVQGDTAITGVRITALLFSCYQIGFIRKKAVIQYNTTLNSVYRACGAVVANVLNDCKIDRFSCLIGEVPTFAITKALQQNGGIVQLKNNKIEFVRIDSLFKQKPVLHIPNTASEEVNSQFLTKHEVPLYISVDDNNSVITGNNIGKVEYSPFKDTQTLNKMAKALIQVTPVKINLNPSLQAGDLVIMGNKELVIVTVAHVFEPRKQYSRLWLSKKSW